MQKTKFESLISLTLFLVIFFIPAYSRAVNTETVGILPAYPDPNIKFSDAWFIYNLDLGQKKEDAIRVINNKKETVIVKLYPVDATTTSDGAFALLPEDAQKKDVGNWIKLPLEEVEIPANSEKIIPFTFQVPDDADSGDHAGGIIMQEVEGKDRNISGTGVKIVTRVGVRVYQTVPGEIRKEFEIIRTDWRIEKKNKPNLIKDFLGINNRTVFSIGLKNKGNVKISPKAKVDIHNIFGSKIAEIPESEIGVIFPRGENKDSVVIWEDAPIFGRYVAKIGINFVEPGVGEGSKELVIWAIPYKLLIIIVFAFMIITLLRLTSKYFFEVSKEKMPIYTVGGEETLGALARKFYVNWKKIARANNLKKPYDIFAGQKLFIPINRKNQNLIEKMIAGGKLRAPYLKKKPKILKLLALAGFALVFLLGGIFYFDKLKKVSKTEKINIDKKETQVDENEDKTKSGAIKKSGISIGIYTSENIDAEANVRLMRKLDLVGYKVEVMSGKSFDYKTTTIEYKSGNKEKAEMVERDLKSVGDIDLVEKNDLEKDIIIFNLIDKNLLPDIDSSQKKSDRREIIKVKIVVGGAKEETVDDMRKIVESGGFQLLKEIEKENNEEMEGISILFSGEEQKKNAELLKNFLQERDKMASIKERGQEGSESDPLLLIMGK